MGKVPNKVWRKGARIRPARSAYPSSQNQSPFIRRKTPARSTPYQKLRLFDPRPTPMGYLLYSNRCRHGEGMNLDWQWWVRRFGLAGRLTIRSFRFPDERAAQAGWERDGALSCRPVHTPNRIARAVRGVFGVACANDSGVRPSAPNEAVMRTASRAGHAIRIESHWTRGLLPSVKRLLFVFSLAGRKPAPRAIGETPIRGEAPIRGETPIRRSWHVADATLSAGPMMGGRT